MVTQTLGHLESQALKNAPLIAKLSQAQPVFWRSDKLAPFAEAIEDVGLTLADVEEAEARLQRFAPYLAQVFPETAATDGIIESQFYRTEKL